MEAGRRWDNDECPLDVGGYYTSAEGLFLHEHDKLDFRSGLSVICLIPRGTIFYVAGVETTYQPNSWTGAITPTRTQVVLEARIEGVRRTMRVPWRAFGSPDGINILEIAIRLVPYTNPLMCLAMSADDSPV